MRQAERTKNVSQQPTMPLPTANNKTPGERLSQRVLLPLRLFLGITFIYAGVQKLTDPQFFKPTAPGYIGKQILAFAHGSPIQYMLLHLALPHATFFGLLIALGEIAIGLGTLFGLLLRPAAFFGILLSLIFFLSASWHVYPYFYGADIVFVFCWVTMFLAGPSGSGLPAIDITLAQSLLEKRSPDQQERFATVLNFLLGTPKQVAAEGVPVGNTMQGKLVPQRNRQINARGRQTPAQRSAQSRRSFLWGLVTGGAGLAGLALFWKVVTSIGSTDDATQAGTNPTPVATASTSSGQGTGTSIAKVSQVPVNSAATFTLPSNGDPGVVIHLNNGQFVAYDATCTHAGCPVQYDSSSRLLLCPCHGAAFDPAKNAAVVQGPANTPLTSAPIHVDTTTGNITLVGQ